MAMAIGKKVLDAIDELLRYEQGLGTNVRLSSITIDDDVDVRAIRVRLGLSQQKFAQAYAIPVATVQNWESGRRTPELGARRYLKLIESSPDFAAKAIRRRRKPARDAPKVVAR
jgi:putative transcriptional regulator